MVFGKSRFGTPPHHTSSLTMSATLCDVRAPLSDAAKWQPKQRGFFESGQA